MTRLAPIWKKRGLIFDPSEHALPLGCEQFAQSPQALIGEGYIRIYFSTRSRDTKTEKYLSHVCYVDFSNDFQDILRIAQHQVIPLGELGCFDEHGIFPINVVPVGDQVYGYTCGWSRRSAVSVETGIGLAVSHDGGRTFQRRGSGPVLSASLNEPCLVGDGFVRHYQDRYYMWYIYGLPWKHFEGTSQAERIYKIAYATSHDGLTWKKASRSPLISDAIGEDECQALPTVIEYQGRYHMYFCFRYATDFRTNPDRGYRLGYAYSDDLQTWTRDDSLVGISKSGNPNDWDNEMMCYPHVFSHSNQLYLLYNGNQFGRYGFGLAVAE
ncbi:glycoside hydrolase family protein [Roseiconus lacunae]|uniref:hypothetical protein n=1 Tax=Roseiconus lacunae TaxID=2605694 RepID=UPI0011F3F4DC|nr:hypothetical protein [Roseiconus lacunae]WRQ49937.1 hypothetical protein U8335_23640 [Stieleria sp. HD01]